MSRHISLLAVVLLLLVTNAYAQLFYKSGHCPLKSTVHSCSPRCTSDSQCFTNKKCCPNNCNYMSCAEPSAFSTGSSYKGSNQETVYCNGVKCAMYEKCQYDQKIRREKCTRT